MMTEWGTWVLVAGVLLALALLMLAVAAFFRGHHRDDVPLRATDGGAKTARDLSELRIVTDKLGLRLETIEARVGRLDLKMTAVEQGIHESVADAAPPRAGWTDDVASSEWRPLSDDGPRGDWADVAPPTVPVWSPSPGDQPVEVRDGALTTSDSLPPAAYVVVGGGGAARVFLNPEVPINEFALTKWEQFFELRKRQPYAAYHTLRAAEVAWDASAGTGTLIQKGMAEAS